MDGNSLLAIGLLLLGVLLLVTEVFIPSGGLLGLITTGVFISSIVCAWAAWGTSNPPLFWAFVGSLVVIIPSAVVGAFSVLPRTRFGKRMLLEAPTLDQVTPLQEQTARLNRLLGVRGRAVTPLVPGGMVEVDEQRVHALSEGLLIDAGTEIQVISVRGPKVIVRAASEATGATDREADPLDLPRPARGSSARLPVGDSTPTAAEPVTQTDAERPSQTSGSPAKPALDFEFPDA